MDETQAKELVRIILDDAGHTHKISQAIDLKQKLDECEQKITATSTTKRAKLVAIGKQPKQKQHLELYLDVVAKAVVEAHTAMTAMVKVRTMKGGK